MTDRNNLTKDEMHEREPLNIIMRYKAERTTIAEAAAQIRAYVAECMRRASEPTAQCTCSTAITVVSIDPACPMGHGKGLPPRPLTVPPEPTAERTRWPGWSEGKPEPSALKCPTCKRPFEEVSIRELLEPQAPLCSCYPSHAVHAAGCAVNRHAEPRADEVLMWECESCKAVSHVMLTKCYSCGAPRSSPNRGGNP